MGGFDLDPNRVFDLTLESLERDASATSTLLSSVNRRAGHTLGREGPVADKCIHSLSLSLPRKNERRSVRAHLELVAQFNAGSLPHATRVIHLRDSSFVVVVVNFAIVVVLVSWRWDDL